MTFDRCEPHAPRPEWDRGGFCRPGAGALRRSSWRARYGFRRFDGLVRSFGQTRSRRQTLRGLAGAGALLALLAAKSGEEATAGDNPVGRLQDRTPQHNRQQRNKNDNKNDNKKNNNNNTSDGGGGGQLGSSQPGTGENGQLGSTDSLLCGYQCNDAITDCEYACPGQTRPPGPAARRTRVTRSCLSQNDACVAACPPG